jgi:hypothetical protein
MHQKELKTQGLTKKTKLIYWKLQNITERNFKTHKWKDTQHS